MTAQALVGDARDAFDAAVDLVGRTGARGFEVGYVHEGVPSEDAGWYAHAQLKGARITVEDHRGPVEAAHALAERILTGGQCTHCRGLVTLREDGAVVFDGHLADGTEMNEERARSMRQCRWRRRGDRWVRGCEDTHPERKGAGPNRAARRRAERAQRRPRGGDRS